MAGALDGLGSRDLRHAMSRARRPALGALRGTTISGASFFIDRAAYDALKDRFEALGEDEPSVIVETAR